MKYNKTRLCIGGIAGFGSAMCLALAARLFYIIKYKDIGMGVLFAGPLMINLATIGVNFAVLSATYLITELSKCDKQKSNLYIGGVAATTALANLGLAAYLLHMTGGELGMLTPVFGSLAVAVLVFAALSIFRFIKASSQEKKEAGSNMASITTTDTQEPRRG